MSSLVEEILRSLLWLFSDDLILIYINTPLHCSENAKGPINIMYTFLKDTARMVQRGF